MEGVKERKYYTVSHRLDLFDVLDDNELECGQITRTRWDSSQNGTGIGKGIDC